MHSLISRCYEKEGPHDKISLGKADLHKDWFLYAQFLSLYYELLRGPTGYNISQTYVIIEPFSPKSIMNG